LAVDDGGRVTGLAPGRGSVVAMAAGQMATATIDVVAASVAAADAPQVVLPFVSAKPGETVAIPLLATGIRDLAGMRVDVSLAPTTPAGAPAPSVGVAVSGPIALDAAVAVNRSKPSAMGLGLLTQGAISEDGVLLLVPLTVPEDAPGNTSYPLTVTYTEVSDFEARPLPIASRSGGLAVPGEYEPPSVTLKGLTGGQFLSGTQELRVAASDNYAVKSVSLLVDGLAAVTVAGTESTLDWDSRRVPDGGHTLQLQAIDTSGNVGVSQTLSVRVDNTPPTARISSPANGSAPRLPLSVVGTASDLNLTSYRLEVLEPGATAYELLASGTTAKSESALGTLGGTGLSDGQYKLRLTVLDAAGNQSVSEVTVTIDATPPQVSFTSPKDGTSFRDPTTVEVKATDAQGIASVKVYLDQQVAPSATLTQSPYRWTLNPGALGDGKHLLRAEAVDSLGNSGFAEVTVLVDRQAPVIQVLTMGRPVVGGKWQLAVSLQDLSPVAYQAEAGRGAAPTQYTTLGPFTETATGNQMLLIDLTKAPEGVDTLRLTVIDAAGNAAQALVPLEVDNTPPVAVLTSPAEGSAFSADRDVVGDAYDAGAGGGHFAGYTLAIGDSGGTWRTLAQRTTPTQAGVLGTVSVSSLTPGPYQLRLTVTDQAGNSSAVTRAIRVLAPTTGDLDGNGQVNVGDVLVALRVTVGLIPATPALVQAGDLVPAGGDGKITISDVIALLRMILHLS
ncbi:MAG TPA: Ig-like domain-containing protein, partial [Armatimonadota bacterium]